jgi:hypothetical protein
MGFPSASHIRRFLAVGIVLGTIASGSSFPQADAAVAPSMVLIGTSEEITATRFGRRNPAFFNETPGVWVA